MPNKIDLQKKELALLKAKKQMMDDLPHLYGFKWYPWAREFFESKNRMNFLCAGNQLSKAHCVKTKVPTPYGFVKMGDLKVGDEVYGRDGKPTKVVGIPYEGIDDCYEIEFDDESKTVVSGEHEWVCMTAEERFRKTYKTRWDRSSNRGEEKPNPNYRTWQIYSTNQLIEKGQYSPKAPRPKTRAVLPLPSPVTGRVENLFDPYLVGLLIGDGCIVGKGVVLTNTHPKIRQYCLDNYDAVERADKTNIGFRGLSGVVTDLGIRAKSKDKHIPQAYFEATEDQRWLLLNGLMDTDGTCNENGIVSYSTISEKLAQQVRELVCSLGGKAKVAQYRAGYKKDEKYHQCNDIYEVRIKIQKNPFRLEDKKAAKFYVTERGYERVIYKITPLGKKHCKCISVDNSDGTYLATKDYIVTHNSSTQIRKCIDWATDRKGWPKLWATRPLVFWYLYPTKEVATIEFEKKWIEEFLPKNDFKGDENYGWKAEYKDKYISALHFNTRVSVYFKTYAQQIKNLQSGTCHAIFCDEELPYESFPELRMRIAGCRGYFHMVFTATLGQQEWKDTIEPDDVKREKFKTASKWQVSYYDSQHYEDGTPSMWTDQRIKEEIEMIGDQREIDRRIHGKFVLSTGLKYPGFERSKNYVEPKDKVLPPKLWPRYVGVDIGSGKNPDRKNQSHPAAICFIAVRPDYKFARIYKFWRGDDETTTAGDVLNKFILLRGQEHMTRQFYDWQCKDFSLIAQRMGEPFEKAEKGHDIGENTLNTLFRHGMLVIDDTGDPEMDKLVNEFCSLKKDESKQTAKDDGIDSARYGTSLIPWNFSQIRAKVQAETAKSAKPKTEADLRREYTLNSKNDDDESMNTLWDKEIASWNEYYEV